MAGIRASPYDPGVMPAARLPAPPLLLAAAALAALLSAAPAAGQALNDPALQVEVVATGLVAPTSMAFVGAADILVLQKSDGRVRRVLDGTLLATPVLDVAVHFSSERGLLGIALDPDFINNRHVYLYYTESATGADTSLSSSTPLGNRVYRYTWNGSALVDPRLVLDLPATPGPNHDGGVIAFGPDDALYAVIGDLNRNGKLQNFPAGPDPDDTGVIFRVARSGAGLPDNPFHDPADSANPMNRYYAYGVRNSFGLAFDPVTGDLWDTENGPNVMDEVNRVPPGFNSGWEQIMGPDALDPQGLGDLWVAPGSVYRDPEFSWAVPVAPAAIGFVHSPLLGCARRHQMLVGDSNCGQIYRFTPNAARDGLSFTSAALQDRVANNSGATCSGDMEEILFGSQFGVVTDLETGADGRMYVVSLNRGAIYRLGPRPGAIDDADGDGADAACDCDPADAGAYAPPSEVPRLRIAGVLPTTLGWDSQSASAGAGTTYDLVTGDVADLRATRDFSSACTLRRDLAAPALSDPQADPAPGAVRYYLTRAANGCGGGTFGDAAASPDPRDALDAALPPDCACAGLSGGALVRFSIVDESLSVWATDDPFIDKAKELLAGGGRLIPYFGRLLDGAGCDSQWTWHTDPVNVAFVEVAIELCDGLPSHIEADKQYWLETVGAYCPWSAVVVSVDDRR